VQYASATVLCLPFMLCIGAWFPIEEEVAFLKKSSAKNFC
jgi:hypothetical protein